ncbi:DUF4383 domain-containing protein [Phytohabitans kaempferiae]|uniref:DUF4383 domain-containing protein n=1 Tax=Phytohabitans kaempferiae TaxID=1620943 RepID=A0ABV6M0G0_9ACTN
MAHIPVNHPMRPLYRTLAGLIGLYILVFGIISLTQTWGDPLFDRGDVTVLGLRTNLAFSIVSTLYGAVLFVGALIGNNVEHLINLAGGLIFILGGLAMLIVLRTDANILNFSMTNVIVSFVFGLLVLTAGLYDKVGTSEDVEAEERYRRNAVPTPTSSGE